MNNKLKQLRIKNNYNVEYMANKLKISIGFYSLIENSNRRLTYDMAIKISSIFNLKPDDIFYEDHKEIFSKNIK